MSDTEIVMNWLVISCFIGVLIGVVTWWILKGKQNYSKAEKLYLPPLTFIWGTCVSFCFIALGWGIIYKHRPTLEDIIAIVVGLPLLVFIAIMMFAFVALYGTLRVLKAAWESA